MARVCRRRFTGVRRSKLRRPCTAIDRLLPGLVSFWPSRGDRQCTWQRHGLRPPIVDHDIRSWSRRRGRCTDRDIACNTARVRCDIRTIHLHTRPNNHHTSNDVEAVPSDFKMDHWSLVGDRVRSRIDIIQRRWRVCWCSRLGCRCGQRRCPRAQVEAGYRCH
jgi:hypothetical protein